MPKKQGQDEVKALFLPLLALLDKTDECLINIHHHKLHILDRTQHLDKQLRHVFFVKPSDACP